MQETRPPGGEFDARRDKLRTKRRRPRRRGGVNERKNGSFRSSTTYHGQWSFAGRLRRPLEVVPEAEIAAWLAAHPEGRAVFVYRSEQEIPAGTRVEYTRRYRGARLALLAPG
jgi:hypothetical protein